MNRNDQLRRMVSSGDAREIRLAAGLTINAFADRIGVKAKTATFWENGERTPQGAAASRYGSALTDLMQSPAVRAKLNKRFNDFRETDRVMRQKPGQTPEPGQRERGGGALDPEGIAQYRAALQNLRRTGAST